MVSAAVDIKARAAAIWRVLEGVPDPEIPVISVVELGIVREVVDGDEGLEVVLTPTYSGCPATARIEQDVRQALDAAGLDDVAVKTTLSPPWTTRWITAAGRAKLAAFGIAPPEDDAGGGKLALFAETRPAKCPRCRERRSELVAEFGSTPCKALWRCLACGEPFDQFKCH